MRIQNLVLMSLFLVAVSLSGSLGQETTQQANSCQDGSEFKCCGDIQLVFRNPGLQPKGAGGHVSAEGNLFAQFQAIGDRADDIVFFGFSFSVAPYSAEESLCEREPWAPSGAYVINYRADTDESDGFFINLQTTLVPDGEYMAAVHGYDDSNTEIARAWTLAIVDNCGDAAVAGRCDSDDYPTQEHQDHDNTEPWPIMLPGDGELDPSKNGAPSGASLTLEFAEPLSELKVYLNGKLLHDKVNGPMNMTEFSGRQWDDDLLPGYGPSGAGGIVAPECSQQPPQQCGTLGESWVWEGRALTDDDIVRVEAHDLAGNLARKEIHIGSGTSGAITDTVPNLQFTVDALTKTVAAGESATFGFELHNTGGTTAHPFASSTGPEGWELTWTPEHQPTEPGARNKQELGVRVPAGEATGTYTVNATIVYDKGGGNTQERDWELTVNVGSGGGVTGPNGTTDPEGEEGAKKEDSPGPALVLLVLGIAFVALRRRF